MVFIFYFIDFRVLVLWIAGLVRRWNDFRTSPNDWSVFFRLRFALQAAVD
jgi:hypothetical protein